MTKNFLSGVRPDTVFRNGKILTVDADNTVAQAVGIFGNQFCSVGDEAAVLAAAGPETKVIDLRGKTVIPGIIDSHNHIYSAGTLMEGIMLFGIDTIDGVKQVIADKVREVAPGEWIIGGGWIESQFKEYRMPNRWDLDEVAPDNPVVLHRLFATSVCNSKALELAGVDKNTRPKRGTMDTDPATGEPTGIFSNGAQILITSHIPQGDIEDLNALMERRIKLAMNEYVRWGITSVIDPGVSVPLMRAYHNVYQKGELPLRVNMMPEAYGLAAISSDICDPAGTEGILDYIGIHSPFGDNWLSIGALKFAMDGGIGSKTAMMNGPWVDGTVSDIPLRLDLDVMSDLFFRSHRLGWSIGIHTCGDRAQDIALAAFVKAIAAHPRDDVRHNIIHGYLPTKSALEIMRDNNIAVSVQPGFMYVEGDIYWDALREEQIHYFKPLRTYLDYGIKVAANSDMTSAHYDPFFGMYATVARKTSQGRSLGDAEKISREEMLRLFTINGAYLTFEDTIKGSIEVGKLADMAVLSDDIMTVPEEKIKDLTIEKTVIDGNIVYQK
ncbi:MAG: amidohydrolase [bacterium]